MIIIWGSRGITRTAETGEFYCPQCRAICEYDLKRVTNFFTLYWIPLFPTGTLGEYVECGYCQAQYEVGILDLTPEQIEGELNAWDCPNCGVSNPMGRPNCRGCQAPPF